MLLSATSRGIHRILSHIVPSHLVLHQSLLQVLERGAMSLFLSNVRMLSPDLVFNFHKLRLYLWRELPWLLWYAGCSR